MLLTIGMAIDASILIYERIKEELAHGTPYKKAVNTGFSGAMAVILDANITHFLVALVLYNLGAGPIKGFAITMIIGIISTLITGIILLKSLFNFGLYTLNLDRISI
jgi:protein-export membrane protein SecD